MLLWIYLNKYMKDVDNGGCSSFPVRGQSLSGTATVMAKCARFSAFGYLQKVLRGAEFGWLWIDGHYAEGDTGRANTQLHSCSLLLHTVPHAPALPVGAPRPPAPLPAQHWINKHGEEQEVKLQGGQKGVCREASAPAAGAWVTRFIRKDIKQKKQREGKLRGERVTGKDVWTFRQTKASKLTRPTGVETKAGSSGLPVLKAWGTTVWLWPSMAKTANRAPLGFRDRPGSAEATWYHCRWPK